MHLWLHSVILSLMITIRVSYGSKSEHNLLEKLLKDYDTLCRPVEHPSETVQLKFGITLIQILDINEKSQVITSNVWLMLQWNDMNFQWDPNEFENITQLRLPLRKTWAPDVSLYNMADMEGLNFDTYDGSGVKIIALNNGSMIFVPPMIIKSNCRMDVTWFPFDEQKCIFKFGSWTHSGNELNIELLSETADLHEYLDNGEWELLEMPGKRSVNYYSCCPDPYVSITYTLHIRRKSLYYFFNLIVPCAVIGFLALLGFTLPPDSGEKLSLGVTVLFSLIMFLGMISESMPSNSDAVPLLGTYLSYVMFMIASSVVSTIVINLQQKSLEISEINGFAKRLFMSWLPWLLRMNQPTKYYDPENSGTDSNGSKVTKSYDEHARIKKEWHFVAIVVDRLCLITSFIFAFVAIAVFLVSANSRN